MYTHLPVPSFCVWWLNPPAMLPFLPHSHYPYCPPVSPAPTGTASSAKSNHPFFKSEFHVWAHYLFFNYSFYLILLWSHLSHRYEPKHTTKMYFYITICLYVQYQQPTNRKTVLIILVQKPTFSNILTVEVIFCPCWKVCNPLKTLTDVLLYILSYCPETK